MAIGNFLRVLLMIFGETFDTLVEVIDDLVIGRTIKGAAESAVEEIEKSFGVESFTRFAFGRQVSFRRGGRITGRDALLIIETSLLIHVFDSVDRGYRFNGMISSDTGHVLCRLW